jgi:hypothetical protein
MLLADELVERPRAHPIGKGTRAVGFGWLGG